VAVLRTELYREAQEGLIRLATEGHAVSGSAEKGWLEASPILKVDIMNGHKW